MTSKTTQQCETWRFQLAKHHIAYVRFIVEAYEGIAQMSSFAGQSEVTWHVPPDMVPAAKSLAEALRDEVGLTQLYNSRND